jgi:flagellar biosynthesis anti-sigma factor FlgM
MNMRIDGQTPPADAEATRRLQSATPAEGASASGTPRVGAAGDRVEVSADAQFVAAAIRAAESAPDVRPEAVERARQALEAGTLGRDTDRLADKIINSLLEG